MSSHHASSSRPAPTPARIRAAVALLAESEPWIVQTVQEQLLLWGACAQPELQAVAEHADARVRMRARALLRQIEVRACLQRFAALQLDGGHREPSALLQGAVLLSHMARTFAPDADELCGWIDAEARTLQRQVQGRSMPTTARMLAGRLAVGLGFHGGDASCLDPEHVAIDRVWQGRLGVPVTLSLIYLLVARQAGLSAAGVAMPDHFLVRLHGVRPVLLDPFHGGRSVTKVDCIRYLRSAGHEQVLDHLRDLSDREVLAHYLRALRRATSYRAGGAAATLGHALEHLEAN